MGDSTRLTDLTVRTLTERIASSDPVPGGGSAAALAGAMGAALVAMVAELTIGRPEYADVEVIVRELAVDARRRQEELLALAQEDAVAYDAVVRARRLPKDSEGDREARATALRLAMVGAAEVPLRTAAVAAEVLDLAQRIAPIGNRNAVSDAGVAAQLAVAALRGAVLNVRINLPHLPAGEPLHDTALTEIARLEALAVEREQAATAVVDDRLRAS